MNRHCSRTEPYTESAVSNIALQAIDRAIVALSEGQNEKAALVLRVGKAKARNVSGRKGD